MTHRKYLRQMFRSLRHQSTVGLVFHAVRSALNDHPLLTLAGVLLLIALIAGAAYAIYR